MKWSMFIVPVLLAVLGAAIRFGKANFLIAGYNTSSKREKEEYDEKALCKFVGNLLFILACIQLVIPIAQVLNVACLNSIVAIATIVFVLVTIAAVIYANTGNRFKKH